MTFPGGTHDLWIRYWLAAGGIDPDKDIETIVVPPPQMVANMKVGTMDCFCVCEPWNLQLIHQDIGYTAITTGELWNKHPEKSFGMRAAYVDKYPKAAKALLMAVMEAQQWCEKAENREETRGDLRQAAVDQLARSKTSPIASRASSTTASGKVVENSPHIMRFWARPRLLSVPEPRPLVHHRGHPLGQIRSRLRHQGADRQGQPRGSLEGRGQGARRCRRRYSGLDLARQGDLLRRQGVRSRKSGCVSEVAVHQACRGLIQNRAARFARGPLIRTRRCNFDVRCLRSKPKPPAAVPSPRRRRRRW